VAAGFNAAMPRVGGWVVAISATLFAYTNLIGWSYYGENPSSSSWQADHAALSLDLLPDHPIGSISAIELV